MKLTVSLTLLNRLQGDQHLQLEDHPAILEKGGLQKIVQNFNNYPSVLSI